MPHSPEARGDPDTFVEAKRLYEQALAGAEASDPETLIAYGYLLECHGRYALRQAVAQYERAIELDPDADKPRYQHIWARAALRETEPAIARYAERPARSPTEVRQQRVAARAPETARGGCGRLAVRHRLVRVAPGPIDGRVATAGAGAAAGKGPRRLSHQRGHWLAWPVPAPLPEGG